MFLHWSDFFVLIICLITKLKQTHVSVLRMWWHFTGILKGCELLTWPAATCDHRGERSRVEQAPCTPGAVKPYRDSLELADGRISYCSTIVVVHHIILFLKQRMCLDMRPNSIREKGACVAWHFVSNFSCLNPSALLRKFVIYTNL